MSSHQTRAEEQPEAGACDQKGAKRAKTAPPTGPIEGWFSEFSTMWPGQAFSLEIDEFLHHEKSEFQDIMVFKSKTFGHVLVLDGVIQLTERDERAYQEMIVHLPMFAHHDPKRVCIVGGGDGGVLREVVRHPGLESISICEIDMRVIEVGKKYFPSVATAWDDPRVQLIVNDAAVYMKQPENINSFDVIIVDSSDPVGPAESLYRGEFYQNMRQGLREGGIICTQAESMWLHLDLIGKLISDCKTIFPNVQYASTQIPTYPCGQIGFLLCSLNQEGQESRDCSKPLRKPTSAIQDALRYYTPELHRAAFVLPAFVQRALKPTHAPLVEAPQL